MNGQKDGRSAENTNLIKYLSKFNNSNQTSGVVKTTIDFKAEMKKNDVFGKVHWICSCCCLTCVGSCLQLHNRQLYPYVNIFVEFRLKRTSKCTKNRAIYFLKEKGTLLSRSQRERKIGPQEQVKRQY